MATQGIVSAIRGGSVMYKVVAGSNGMVAPKMAAWIRAYTGELDAETIYRAARSLGFGAQGDLVVQGPGGDYVVDPEAIEPEDLGALYFDEDRFSDARFNPRWECGTADHVEVVVLD